jgi:hypothetical protein
MNKNKAFLLVSAGVLFTVLGCSGKPLSTASKSPSLPVVQTSSAATDRSAAVESTGAMPGVLAGLNHEVWHSENVKDALGDAVALKHTSLDGKFDLVVLVKGTHSFVSLAKHAQWETVHHLAAHGKLMNLRAKFEDGQERRIEWDELGPGTTSEYSVVWSYTAKAESPVGPAVNYASDSVGGDELLVQDMSKHTAMVLEVQPGVTTQFDIAGLAREIEKARAPKTEPVLAATQTETE